MLFVLRGNQTQVHRFVQRCGTHEETYAFSDPVILNKKKLVSDWRLTEPMKNYHASYVTEIDTGLGTQYFCETCRNVLILDVNEATSPLGCNHHPTTLGSSNIQHVNVHPSKNFNVRIRNRLELTTHNRF